MPLPEVFSKSTPEFFKHLVFEHLKMKSFKDIEIEARLGKITSLITRKRMDYQVEHPIIFQKLPYEYCFENGVDKNDFTPIRNTIVQDNPVTVTSGKVTIIKRIRRIETEKDVVYQRKVKLTDLTIHLPGYRYDVRVSVSRETPANAKDFATNGHPLIRIRNRESYQVGCLLFDFTITNTGLKKEQKTHEIEMELKDPGEGMEEFVSVLFNLAIMKK